MDYKRSMDDWNNVTLNLLSLNMLSSIQVINWRKCSKFEVSAF